MSFGKMLNSRCVWICLIAAWKHKFQTNNKWMFKKDERTYRTPFTHRLAFLTERLLNQPAGISNTVRLMFSSILFTVMFKKPYSLNSNLYEPSLGHLILWEIHSTTDRSGLARILICFQEVDCGLKVMQCHSCWFWPCCWGLFHVSMFLSGTQISCFAPTNFSWRQAAYVDSFCWAAVHTQTLPLWLHKVHTHTHSATVTEKV